MFYGSIGDTELSKQMPNHLRDDLSTGEVLAVVNSDGKVDHLRKNDHVPTMSANDYVLTLPLLLPCSPEFHEQFLLTWG